MKLNIEYCIFLQKKYTIIKIVDPSGDVQTFCLLPFAILYTNLNFQILEGILDQNMQYIN